ncbi:MAG: hypothetical protein ABI288_02535 [Ginsengibacter sp.]
MKHLFCAIALLMSISFTATAQKPQPKIIALLTKASWCYVCQANEPRFMKDIMPIIADNKDVKLLINDLSDKKTIAMSRRILQKVDIYDFAEKNPATGMLYFFSAEKKKLLSKISLAQSSEDIDKAYQKALSKE